MVCVLLIHTRADFDLVGPTLSHLVLIVTLDPLVSSVKKGIAGSQACFLVWHRPRLLRKVGWPAMVEAVYSIEYPYDR
jgi:hypothetical protein